MIIKCLKLSEQDMVIFKQQNQQLTVTQLLGSYVLQLVGELPPLIDPHQIDDDHFRVSNYLCKLNEKPIEVQMLFSDNQNQVMLTYESNNTNKDTNINITYLKEWKKQWEISLKSLIPLDYVDSISFSRYVILHIHSSVFFIDQDRIVSILQLENEIQHIFPINQGIGLSYIVEDKIEIYNGQKLSLSLEGICQEIVNMNQFLTCILTDTEIHIINHSYEIKKIPIVAQAIRKYKDCLLILTNNQLKIINNFNIPILEFVQCIHQIENIIISGDYILNCTQSKTFIYQLQQKHEFRSVSRQFQVKEIQIYDNKFIILDDKNKLSLYDHNYQLQKSYQFDTEKKIHNFAYCPHYEGIIFYENQMKYLDQQPQNNLILQVEQIQNCFIQFIDFKTNHYRGQQGQQSYLIQQKISCGFIINQDVKQIINFKSNQFLLVLGDIIQIIQITNQPYLLQNIFEFGVLNQALLNFKNSIPLEDLERIPFLRHQNPMERILFAEFWSHQGIIQTVYSIKLANIQEQRVSLVHLHCPDVLLQRVLCVRDNGEIYLLSNNEELYLLLANELKLVYVCDYNLASALTLNNQTYIIKENGQVLITELHNPKNILFRFQI